MSALLPPPRCDRPPDGVQLVAPFEENPRQNYEARIGQYEKLATLMQSTRESTGADAMIMAGDFNVPARMRSLAPLRNFLREAWLDAGRGWGATVPEFLPFTRIDHVWVSQEIDVSSVRVRRLDGSDHRAVIMDFEL